MGSPLTVTLADIRVTHNELNALSTSPHPPSTIFTSLMMASAFSKTNHMHALFSLTSTHLHLTYNTLKNFLTTTVHYLILTYSFTQTTLLPFIGNPLTLMFTPIITAVPLRFTKTPSSDP